jgi:hypothetical protein
MVVTLRSAALHAQVGEVTYPTLPCRTVLTLKEVNAQAGIVTVSEHVVSGRCIDVEYTLQVSDRTLTVVRIGSVNETGSLTKAS